VKLFALLLLSTAFGFAGAGCGGSSSLVASVTPKLKAELRQMHGRAGFLSPTRLAFYTSASGSCPNVPHKLTVQTPNAIRVDMVKKSPTGSCTADLRIYPVVISINPKQIDVHHRLTISLYDSRYGDPVVYHVPPL